ncbi:MAG: SMP-30/gluconolactonase/LRE family protein [Alphaproteobacteria bacterium]|nr:SMP-30/gluconolactonase/LRE family protein [Alphaproteobacteria bacterium]
MPGNHEFPLALADVRFTGAGLVRPECVLSHVSGCLFAADWSGNGGVSVIAADGSVRRILARKTVEPMRPNGIALEEGGSFLLAHLGPATGGIYRLSPSGLVEPVLTELQNRPLPPSNFPLVDSQGRLWLSISTTKVPRADDYRPGATSGLIVVKDRNGARIAAEGLGYANELAFSADERFLFVNETFARRLTRFTVDDRGGLRDKMVVAEFGTGTYPDGITLDETGGMWITSIISNRLICVEPDGHQTVVLEDSDPEHVAWVEAAFLAGEMGRPHLDNVKSRMLRNVSSLAFGGEDLRTAYLGCLLGDAIAVFRAPRAGLRARHFDLDIRPLTAALEDA